MAVGHGGGRHDDYTIVVTRPPAPSTDATLSALRISAGTLTLATGTTSYTGAVASTVTSITVTATATDSAATVRGIGVHALSVGDTAVAVTVTAEDGTTTQAYTIVVTRPPAPSTDATLSALRISAGTLTPAFATGTTSYTGAVASTVTSITVTATATDSAATVRGIGVHALSVGDTAVAVTVTAEDGTTTQAYTIVVTRPPAPSTDATLSALRISAGTLTPAFATGTTSYTGAVASTVTSITVTATATDSAATVRGIGVHALSVGDTAVAVTVTAEDGTTTQAYTIVVTRPPAPSTDATLSALRISAGTLTPAFATGTTSYTGAVASTVTSITVTATATDSAATVRGIGVHALSVGDTAVAVTVTAEDGTTTQAYTIVVTRPPAPSTDATLSALRISAGTLTPAFATGTTSYTGAVASTVTTVTVAATTTDTNATTTGTGSHSLNTGANTINVVVTAEDGTTTRTYSIVVTRAASADATLDNLGISEGTLTPVFAAGTTAYTADVANTVTGLTVTAVVTHDAATVTGTGVYTLNVGDTTLTVTVTAADGTTTQDYTIVVTRLANTAPVFADAAVEIEVAENSAAGTAVGAAVEADDPDAGDTLVYSISGSSLFSIVTTSGQIEVATGASLDYETTTSYAVTVTVVDAAGLSDSIDVTIDVTNVVETAVLTSLSVGSVGRTSATVTATLTNVDSASTVVYFRYRTPGGAWTSATSDTTVGTSATTALSGLTLGTTYRAQASLDSGFSTTVQDDFTTVQPTVSGVTIGTIMRTSAVATISIANSDGAALTVYLRWRTPRASGAWTEDSVATAAASVDYSLSGLTDNAAYRLQASHDSTFPSLSREEADFATAANAFPVFPSATLTREVKENRLGGTLVGDPVVATDANGDAITYTLGGTDVASFEISSTTGQITVGSTTVLDYETKDSYSVTVTATDPSGANSATTVTIEVQDIREAGILGRIVFTVGNSGADYGVDDGAYGTLDIGTFPAALFADGLSRSVDQIYEDADGAWYFTYSGGLAGDWLDDQELLDEIVVDVKYEGDVDDRSFVLGGFVDSYPGTRGLKIAPPLPSRDWASRSGQEVAFQFRRHVAHMAAPTVPLPLVPPTADTGSFAEWLAETTPGGPVMAQMLITLIVFAGFLIKAPATPWGIMLAALVLIMTPWLPTIWGFGSTMAASIVFVNVVAGAYCYKIYIARTES